MNAHSLDIAEGYTRFPRHEGFSDLIGPLHWMADSQGLHMGLRIEAQHCNPAGTTHGGLIATLMDMQLPLGARYLLPALDGHLLFTINLTMDFLAPVHLGQWLYGTTQLLKRTQRMVFAQGYLFVGTDMVARASGNFRISAPTPNDLIDFPALRAQERP